ncbi:MAG: DUF4175 family protein [Rudaea sp.]|uniref:hypothetical protein n=1 Tax=Rudaea sp. TaxID=2136325 RepID=UPI0039E421A4
MNADACLRRLRLAAVRRRMAIVAAGAVPIAVAGVVLAARIGGAPTAYAITLSTLAVAAVIVYVARRRIDGAWLARRLDTTEPGMEDSAALLLRGEDSLTDLQRLQRARLQARLTASECDLREPWPKRRLLAASAVALALLVAAACWRAPVSNGIAADSNAGSRNANATALTGARIDIEAPAYTRLAPRSEAALDAKAPEGSRLRWSLRFDSAPKSVTLAFHDGSRLELTHDGADWRGERALAASALYRVVLDGVPPLADDRLHRLDAIPDRAPEVRVLEPEKTLTLLDAQQKTWDLAFEADDDYGIASAELQITLAQGTGENIKFKEQSVALSGEPVGAEGARHQRFHHSLDLAALGIAQGDDVIVRAVVADNREPQANTTRSASFILRWPAEASNDSSGLEGIAQKTMPAYFRSQRQIIIDSEALLAERATLADKVYLGRSDAIGVDQKILRLRYGQFLGEEAESAAAHDASQPHGHERAAPVRSFNEALHDPAAEARVDALAEAHERHAPNQAAPKFGQEGDTVAEYGHVHDIAEAATLLDPETKATLKSALAEMWQAELHLRQGRPDEALPYEHRALEYIKQVQQSTRIYLARVGLELPVPDETRRLSGERKGVDDRIGTLAATTADDDAAIVRLWQSLSGDTAPDWDAAGAWLHAREARLPDALGVLAAVDRARRDPACVACRNELRDLLWPLLPVPAAASAPRAAADAGGRAYLDALQAGEGAQR